MEKFKYIALFFFLMQMAVSPLFAQNNSYTNGSAEWLVYRFFGEKSFPDKDFIKRVYEAVFNFYQIPVGEGMDQVREFILSDFVSAFKLPVRETFSALKILMQEGYWSLSDGFFSPSRIKFLVNETELYKFQVKKPKLDPLDRKSVV